MTNAHHSTSSIVLVRRIFHVGDYRWIYWRAGLLREGDVLGAESGICCFDLADDGVGFNTGAAELLDLVDSKCVLRRWIIWCGRRSRWWRRGRWRRSSGHEASARTDLQTPYCRRVTLRCRLA